jgi:intraflagellar transport protein 122
LALGLFNGNVSIRTSNGEEKVRIERGTSPVWSLQFNPNPGPEKDFDVLAVTDWNQKIGFFQLSGRQVGKERNLGYDPTCINHFSNGDFMVMGGSDRAVTLWTSDGIKLGQIAEVEGWVWSCKVKPKSNYVAVASNDGTISVHQIVFGTVHGLYQDRYAYRENMTDVVIHHLSTDQRARIKCRDYVKKIAVYRDRLAVQLPERVIIYELYHDDITDMHYRIKEKIHKKFDCSLLVVTSQHIILCLEKKLQMYNFTGDKEREWNLEALIRYIKVTGGQRQREGLLVGLRNGQVLQIFIDNPFPVPLIGQGSSIRCLDLNCTRTKLAVVDEENICSVYNISTKELIYQEPKANSVAWNIEHEEMLCYSGNGILSFKAGNNPPHHQQMQGFVVGFKGSKIFCLNVNHISSVDVPQSAALEKYIAKHEFNNAYNIACLGVTESDWRKLAMECLENLDLEIARKSFIRVRDMRYLELVTQIEKRMTQGANNNMEGILGEILAHQGKYHEVLRTL